MIAYALALIAALIPDRLSSETIWESGSGVRSGPTLDNTDYQRHSYIEQVPPVKCPAMRSGYSPTWSLDEN